MKGNRFYINIKEKVDFWEEKISLIKEVLEEWLIFQRFWIALEPIFS